MLPTVKVIGNLGPFTVKQCKDGNENINGKFYMSIRPVGSLSHYLHNDGLVRPSTTQFIDGIEQFTGWYTSLSEVAEAYAKYLVLTDISTNESQA